MVFVAALACTGGGETTPTQPPAAPAAATATMAPAAPAVATPTTAPAPPPDTTTEPMGKFVQGSTRVPAGIFVHAFSATGLDWTNLGWGIVEYLLRWDEEADAVDPAFSIAESWEVAPDQRTITFKIREGVPFHKDWGNVTAHDVAWSFNNAMREGSIFYRVGSLQPYMENWEAIDDRTVVLHWKEGEFLPWWAQSFSNVRSASAWIGSKKVVDQLGEEQASQTYVGTGPFQVKSWAVGEKLELEAVVPHWRQTPKAAAFDVVEIREPLAMAAAFETGEVDFAPLPNNLIKETQGRVPESWTQVVGFPQAHCVNFTGNYWAETEYSRDKSQPPKQVFPRPGFRPELPWIGDPRDPKDMEQGQKVRLALSLAIDREAILEEIFAGLGFTQAMLAYGGFGPDMPYWKEEWERHYEPDRAKQLLAEAGYPNGFSMPFYVPPDHPRVNPEAGQAVAQFWREVGVDVQIDSTTYAARRPKRFDGIDDVPWYHCGVVGQDIDQPSGDGIVNTFRGWEVPEELWHFYDDNFTETDKEKRIQNNVALADWANEWNLQTVFSVVNTHFLISPEIKEWTPHEIDAPIFTNPETVVVEK